MPADHKRKGNDGCSKSKNLSLLRQKYDNGMIYLAIADKTMQPIYPESDFLFARPSFWQGVATLADVGGTLMEYNSSVDENQADERALAADWSAVGKDINNAIETTEKEETKR